MFIDAIVQRLPPKIFGKLDLQTRRQIVLFLFVGGMNTLFSYLCYAFFIYLGLHYSLAAGFATCLGILFNFNTTGRIVFKNKNHWLIFRFFAVYGFTYCLNVFFLTLLKWISGNDYLNGLMTVLPLAVISFLLNKLFVFRVAYETN